MCLKLSLIDRQFHKSDSHILDEEFLPASRCWGYRPELHSGIKKLYVVLSRLSFAPLDLIPCSETKWNK